MGAALLVRSFAGLLDEDPGFESKGVLAMEVPLPSSQYDDNKSAQFWKTQLLPAVRALPGVEDAAAANCAPMSLSPTGRFRFATRFGIEGRTFDPGRYPVAQYRWMSPDYFRVLGIPLKRGRWLTEADRDQPRYLINETLARQFFPHEDPTAHRLIMGVMDPHHDSIEIAGVVGDVRDLGLDEPVPPTLYMISSSPRMTLLVKTAGDPMQLAAPIREAIHRADPGVAVLKVAPVERYVADSLAARRFALTLLCAFAGLAALLTAAGVYGLLAYSVSGRVREFGIRAALGATPGNLLRMIVREARCGRHSRTRGGNGDFAGRRAMDGEPGLPALGRGSSVAYGGRDAARPHHRAFRVATRPPCRARGRRDRLARRVTPASRRR